MNKSWPDGTVETLSDEEYMVIDLTGSFHDPDEMMGKTVRLISHVKKGYPLPGQSPMSNFSWVCRPDQERVEHILLPRTMLKQICPLPDAYRVAIHEYIDRTVYKAFREVAKTDLEIQFTLYQQRETPFLVGISKHGTCLVLNVDHPIAKSMFMANNGSYKTFVVYQYTLWDGQTLSDTSIDFIKEQGGISWLKSLSTKKNLLPL